MKRTWLSFIVAASLVVGASTAFADGRDEARDLVYKGDDLFAAAHYEEALSAYLKAADLFDVPTTRIEVARTLYALGRWTDAYEAAQALQHDPGFAEPEAFTAARAKARELGRELRERLPTLKIEAAGLGSDREVIIRSGSKRFGGKSGEDIVVDPGTYTIEVPGALPMPVTVVEKEHRTIEIATSSDGASPVPTGKRRRLSPVVISAIVVSGAGLTVGTIAGSVYIARQRSLVDDCKMGSSDCTSSRIGAANAAGWVSNVGFGVALAGGGVALVSALVDRHARADDTQTGLMVSPSFVGYRGRFE